MEPATFYITTPIYYVNDKPHIGHAYTTILADVLARYHRMLNVPTFFLTGTDEHGQKVEKAAIAAGMTSQQQADETVLRFQALWKKLDITNDDFIRTTEERHKKVVQQILQTLYDAGEIYRDEYDGWYCTPCERFFTEKDLQDGCCPECSREVERIREANYFFKMGAYQEWLVDYIEKNPSFIQPAYRRNETLGFLRKPLNDLCISRPKTRLNWGIEIPFDTDYVTYVWFDALVNYITGVGYLSDDAMFDQWWPASYHLVGKDILTTHTVYWPTMLKAMGLPMPKSIFAHGWWLIGESKMSKSIGNVVDPMAMVDQYGVDAFRYFLMAEMSLGQDASFTQEAFVRRFNSDLANDLGNLLSRVLKMISSYCDARIPTGDWALMKGDAENDVWQTIQQAVLAMEQSIDEMKLDRGIADVLNAVRAVNRYLEVKQPWTQAKAEDKAPLALTLYTAAECLRVVAALLHPVMPAKMGILQESLGQSVSLPGLDMLKQWAVLQSGTPIASLGSLFPRIEVSKSTKSAPKEKAKKRSKKKNELAEITYNDFMNVQLKTARVLHAERIEGADKLLRVEVEIGADTRQLVAGVAQHYTPENIVGKMVVVVTNLKSVTIRGVKSNGMLLAANEKDGLKLITVDGDVKTGLSVR